MKHPLFFVFLLVAPLIGRVLSGENTSANEACDNHPAKSIEMQSAPAVPAPASAQEPRASTSAPAGHKPTVRRIPRAQAFTFM